MEKNASTDTCLPLTPNSTLEIDYFKEVYSDELFAPIAGLVFAVGLIIATLGPISIIWYERNCGNRFRTIINQLFATSAWYMLAHVSLVFIPEGVRVVYGPYGEAYCDMLTVLRNILWIGVILTLDIILILRYAFIFVLKNFAIINDDILTRMLSRSILLVAIWAAFVKRMAPGKLPLNYYLCCGINPNEDDEEGDFLGATQKYNTGRIILISSVILHLIMTTRIMYYQYSTVRNEQPIQLGTIENDNTISVTNSQRPSQNTKKGFTSSNKNKTILDMITQITFLLCLVIIGITVRISDEVEPKNYNLKKYKYIPLTIHFFGPVFGYIAFYAILFRRNTLMRQTIWRRIKSQVGRKQVQIE